MIDVVAKNVTNEKITAARQVLSELTGGTSLSSKTGLKTENSDMLIRISEIEIHPQFLEDYTAFLKEEAAQSVQLEAGVIAIFPMYQKDNSAQFRIVEIYADTLSYQSHLKTPHFQKYKSSTLKMVKSLKLIDMKSIDSETMQAIFEKLE